MHTKTYRALFGALVGVVERPGARRIDRNCPVDPAAALDHFQAADAIDIAPRDVDMLHRTRPFEDDVNVAAGEI